MILTPSQSLWTPWQKPPESRIGPWWRRARKFAVSLGSFASNMGYNSSTGNMAYDPMTGNMAICPGHSTIACGNCTITPLTWTLTTTGISVCPCDINVDYVFNANSTWNLLQNTFGFPCAYGAAGPPMTTRAWTLTGCGGTHTESTGDIGAFLQLTGPTTATLILGGESGVTGSIFSSTATITSKDCSDPIIFTNSFTSGSCAAPSVGFGGTAVATPNF